MIRSLPPSSFYLKWRCPAEQNPQSHRRRRLYRVRRIWRWTREASTAPFFPLNWRSRNRLKPLEVQSFLSSTGVHQKTAWIAHLGPSIALHLVKLRYVVIVGLICPWSVSRPCFMQWQNPVKWCSPFLLDMEIRCFVSLHGASSWLGSHRGMSLHFILFSLRRIVIVNSCWGFYKFFW